MCLTLVILIEKNFYLSFPAHKILDTLFLAFSSSSTNSEMLKRMHISIPPLYVVSPPRSAMVWKVPPDLSN